MKKIYIPFHCQDVIGQHNVLKYENDYISLCGGTFSDESGISCWAIRFKCSPVATRSFLSAHVTEIPEVTGDYCRYFLSGKVWFLYEAGGPERINKSCKGS
jgi:hypothetical protein